MNTTAKVVPVAANLIAEDTLRKIIKGPGAGGAKTDPKAPRNQHSCFGDFPADSAPKKTTFKLEPSPITAAEQSVAKTGACKLTRQPFPNRQINVRRSRFGKVSDDLRLAVTAKL